MAKDRKRIIWAGAAIVALGIYLFWHWYTSPYQECVRAATSFGSELAIKHRDQPDNFSIGGYTSEPDYMSDDEIWAEQRRLAAWSCGDALRRAAN
jgi:hypothetical protein